MSMLGGSLERTTHAEAPVRTGLRPPLRAEVVRSSPLLGFIFVPVSIERNGVRLAHKETGSGEPACILIHGWGTDRSSLARQRESLGETHRVVSVDLRGFGESSSPPQRYTIDRYADDVAYVATKLGLERFIVIGHCLGGLVALELAATHSERVGGLAILESFVVPSARTVLALRGTLESLCQDDGGEFAARLLRHLGSSIEPGPSACPQHVLVSAFEGLLAYDSRAAAAQVKCPFLYVGTNHRYADEDELRRCCPQVVIERLAGRGHYFPLEAASELNPILARFLARTARAEDQ